MNLGHPEHKAGIIPTAQPQHLVEKRKQNKYTKKIRERMGEVGLRGTEIMTMKAGGKQSRKEWKI